MTGRQKILKVLKDIKKESEINPDPSWMIFYFSKRGIEREDQLNYDQQKRILIRLDKEKVIEIKLPTGRNDYEQALLSLFKDGLDFIQDANTESVPIKILKPFYFKYFWYSITSWNENWWNYINPFWLIWKAFNLIFYTVEWLWNKSKVITIISGVLITLLTLLAIDYSLAWDNVDSILNFFKSL